MILESIQLTSENAPLQRGQSKYNSTTKTLHILNFNGKNCLKVGRGHDNDLRIADISVSRTHAFFKFDPKTGMITVEDNSSKFGTLVLLKQPLVVKEGMTYYFQTGRTIMKVSCQPEWSFFGSLIWGFSNGSTSSLI